MNGKHHSLPQFYLNGFVDEERQFLWAFKKEYESTRWFYPKGIYYENGLNDVYFGEGKYIDLENGFFRDKDNMYSKAFEEFREKYHYGKVPTPMSIKADIVEFFLGLYWRVPGGLNHVVDLIENEGLLTGDLQLLCREDNHYYVDEEIPEIIEGIKSDVRNQKVFMTAFYEENIQKHNWERLDYKFFVYETYEPMIIGDIPFVPLKHEIKRGKIMEEFIVPLDRNHILIYAEKHPPFLEPNLLYAFFSCIIDGPSERISCSNKDYLQQKVGECKEAIVKMKQLMGGNTMENSLASLIQLESTFKNLDQFIDYYRNRYNAK